MGGKGREREDGDVYLTRQERGEKGHEGLKILFPLVFTVH